MIGAVCENVLKSGNGNSQVFLFSDHYGMRNIYFKFYIFLPKHFGATSISVCGPFPGLGYCCCSLIQAVRSQAGHIKLEY